MAGNYPNVPGARMAYDRDGTVGFRYLTSDNVISQMPSGDLALMNDESVSAWTFGTAWSTFRFGIIFPQLRDLVAYYIYRYDGASNANVVIYTSPDTTNGIDGVWTTQRTIAVGSPPKIGDPAPGYRSGIVDLVVPGIKAMRFEAINDGGSFWTPARFGHIHLYGKPAAVSDRLEFWHPTLNQSLDENGAYFDWGNRPRGTSEMRQVRVKNQSGSLTANDITVGVEAPTDATPTFVSQHQLSYQGSAYAPTVAIPSLGPGEISGVINVEQTLLGDAVLGVWAQRLFANAGAWV